jgi:tRNA G37 N-methylase Trm5
LEGDVREIIDRIPPVNRIIMNLPKGAYSYMDIALSKLKSNGVIHYHEMLGVNEVNERLTNLEVNLINSGYILNEVDIKNLGSYSAGINHYCLDLFINKKERITK